MSLHCADGARAEFPPRPPPIQRERGTPWRPPDATADTCLRCGMVGWQHRARIDPIAEPR